MNAGEWTLRSRRVVTPSGIRPADVVIRNEIIHSVLDHDGPESEGVILDAGDLVVMPGLVMLHRESSGRPAESRFEAMTRDAGAGGVTTLVDLPPMGGLEPNSPMAFKARKAAAEGKIRVDCGLVLGLGRGNGDLVASWVEAGVIGIEALIGEPGWSGPGCSTEADLRVAMPTLARLGRPLLVRSEPADPPSGSSSRSGATLPDAEYASLRILIRLCRESRCPIHLIQPTSSEALPMIAEARAEGLPITVETGPHHLCPADEGVALGSSRDRLWEGLRSGLIDAIGSDQPRVAGAMGLRFAFPAVWTEARRRGLGLDQVARWMAGRTASAFGLDRQKGTIAPRFDADFVVFDPDAPALTEEELLGRPKGHAPGWVGRVEATVLRGSMIYQGGRFPESTKGSVVLRFEETLPAEGTAF